VDKDRFVPKLTDLFPTFHADTPDVERLAQVLSEHLLMIGGKCSLFRAKPAKVSWHLPLRTPPLLLPEQSAKSPRMFAHFPVREEDIVHLSPARHEHINFYGKYFFNVAEGLERKRLRPFRKP